LQTNCEDGSCVDTFEKCGGTFFNTSVPCCEEEAKCIVKNYFYAQCLTSEKAETNIGMYGWDGRVLDCEEMPEELMPEVEDMPEEGATRKMLTESGEYAMGYGGYAMGYGSKGGYGSGMPAEYGSRDFEFSFGMEDMEGMDAPAPGPASMMTDKDMDMYSMGPSEGPSSMMTDKEMEMPAKESMAPMPATAPVTPDTKIVESDLVLGEGCDKCAPIFGQCADKGDIVSCCGKGLQCTKKNGYYAQCLPAARAERNVQNYGWDGAVLECGEVML
jgi:hypothetical protein